jgi:hypothetical protein
MFKRLAIATACLAATSALAQSDPAAAPEPVRAPAGHRGAMDTVGVGEITYECREKKDTAGQFEWAFVAPSATLYDMKKKTVGRYYGGPTWESNDGSKVTGKQVAVAPSPNAGSIPLQLVKAEPAMGTGALSGVSYIQRLDTKSGVAPASACDVAAKGKQERVAYEARYVFYRPAPG